MAKRTFTGTVIRNKMEKTVVVAVDVPKKHRFYSKKIKLTKRFKAHDDLNCAIADRVLIEESRPIGKTVNWIVIKKMEESSK